MIHVYLRRSKLFSIPALFILSLLSLSLFNPLPQTAHASGSAPYGNLDIASGTELYGWAKDNDSPNTALRMALYIDGVLVDSFPAKDPGEPAVGQHRFDYKFAPLGTGTHFIWLYALGVNSSGQIDGVNAQISGAPFNVTTDCSQLSTSTLQGWCQGNPNYWIHRQTDTKVLANDNIKIGIDNSYGGAIMQLYGPDRATNLIYEHGGAAMQLSLWGFGQTNTTNNYCPGWSAYPTLLDPIQAISPNCGWDSTGNDVDYQASTGTGGWTTRLDDPYLFNRADINWPGLHLGQTVELGDVYAKVTYTIANDASIGTDTDGQQMPAIITGPGLNAVYYYPSSSGVVSGTPSSVTGKPMSNNTEKWWSMCNSNSSRCLTVATFSPLADTFNVGSGNQADVGGHFAIRMNSQNQFTIYLFPGNYNSMPIAGGPTVQQRINALPHTP